MKIELLDHPGKRHVTVSRLDRRYLFICPACGDKTIEPAGRPQGRIVRCDTCQAACKPWVVNALPDQHGIYIDGKCVGYCTKEQDAQVWYTERVDPALVAEVNAVITKAYGGETVVFEKPVLTAEEAKLLGMPPPDEDAPPDDDDIEEDDDDTDMEDDLL